MSSRQQRRLMRSWVGAQACHDIVEIVTVTWVGKRSCELNLVVSVLFGGSSTILFLRLMTSECRWWPTRHNKTNPKPTTQMPRELPQDTPKDVRWKTSGRFPGPRFVMV